MWWLGAGEGLLLSYAHLQFYIRFTEIVDQSASWFLKTIIKTRTYIQKFKKGYVKVIINIYA